MMTDSEILDWLELHGCPVKAVEWLSNDADGSFQSLKWIHTIGRRPPHYKRKQYDSLREAVLAAIPYGCSNGAEKPQSA